MKGQPPVSGIHKSDIRRKRVPISTTIVPAKCERDSESTYMRCDARGLKNFRHNHEISCICQMISDIAKATAVPAPEYQGKLESRGQMSQERL